MNTSFSRMLVIILTLVSPWKFKGQPRSLERKKRRREAGQVSIFTFANWESSTAAGLVPRLEHIWVVRAGHELPAKMRVLRMFGVLMFVEEV